MKFLLDAHAFVWWDADKQPGQLSPRVFALLKDRNNVMVVSIVTVWEIQIKVQLGKLKLAAPLVEILKRQREDNGIELFPLALPHVLTLDSLPHHHRDPFDRILVAQAVAENMPIISKDSKISQYPVTVIW